MLGYPQKCLHRLRRTKAFFYYRNIHVKTWKTKGRPQSNIITEECDFECTHCGCAKLIVSVAIAVRLSSSSKFWYIFISVWIGEGGKMIKKTSIFEKWNDVWPSSVSWPQLSVYFSFLFVFSEQWRKCWMGLFPLKTHWQRRFLS